MAATIAIDATAPSNGFIFGLPAAIMLRFDDQSEQADWVTSRVQESARQESSIPRRAKLQVCRGPPARQRACEEITLTAEAAEKIPGDPRDLDALRLNIAFFTGSKAWTTQTRKRPPALSCRHVIRANMGSGQLRAPCALCFRSGISRPGVVGAAARRAHSGPGLRRRRAHEKAGRSGV